MRLSGIKLAGFKSFVDPAQLPLPSNLTAVVGPNGCGKSNIIDAVRWVLGETSIKHLRAADTEDVIFNGSRSRKPAGRASVELLFDNSDGQITGPYAAYAEIAVKRELTRDGGSQYYLNGRKCLKRDVTDLFLGTGLGGKNQYAIIEQGMVSRMVEAKPEELRQWLEEAAGISKYKERRRETESRIRQTRENLARLQDLQNELTSRLEVLVRQAANAEKYREFKQQERQAQAELLLLRGRALAEDSRQHEAAIAALAADLEAARAQLGEAEQAATDAETAQQTASAALNAEQARVYEAEAALSRAEQALSHARELAAMQARELEQARARLGELQRRHAQEQQREAEARQQLAQAEGAAQAARAQAETEQQQVGAAEAQLQAEQAEWERVAAQAQQPVLAAEGERVRVQQLERALRGAQERIARLETERASLQTGPVQASLFDADAELATIAEELARLQDKLESQDRELSAAREQRAARETQLADARQQFGSARARIASLETLQQAALRQDDKEYRGWLDQHGLRERQRLAETLRVEAGWEAAVEHVLEALLQAPLLADAQALLYAPAAGPKTGGALVGAEGVAVDAPSHTLAHRVQGPAALRALLIGIHVCDTPDTAAAQAAQLPEGESLVTRDAVWRGRGWVRYPRRDTDRSGVIARSAQLRELKSEITTLEAAVRDGESALSELQGRTRALEAERRDSAQKLDQLRGRQAQRMAFRQSQAVRLEQMEGRARALAQDIEQLRAHDTQQQQELQQAREQLVSLEADAERVRAQRAEQQQRLNAAREAAQAARSRVSRALQAAGDAQAQLAARAAAVNALQRSVQELDGSLAGAAQQLAAIETRSEAAAQPLHEREQAVGEARSAVDGARERLRAAREALTLADAARTESQHTRRGREQRKDQVVEQLQQARLDFENLRARREALDAQFADTGASREELLAGLPDEATPLQWEDKLAALGRRIDRLGAINLAAIQELDEARERETYLNAQRADVEQALTTLEDAMRKLDRETEDRFGETFQRVDTIFRDRFPRLFGGGEAYLELTGDDRDAGNTSWGVRVMARPPGKRNSTIQLLSGGEKAMTAVALLFALFELNPAPFCLMDEVDAPLDDANVSRYCGIIREMSQRVQFIIITHNKITMELAQQLHGVTMQEPGVSRLVAVDVEQALAYAGEPAMPENNAQAADERAAEGAVP